MIDELKHSFRATVVRGERICFIQLACWANVRSLDIPCDCEQWIYGTQKAGDGISTRGHTRTSDMENAANVNARYTLTSIHRNKNELLRNNINSNDFCGSLTPYHVASAGHAMHI